MEARIVFPAAVGIAAALGIGFSGLVPTQMVAAPPPPWASSAPEEHKVEPGPTWRFAVAPPVDLDPTQPVGPVDERPDFARGEQDPQSIPNDQVPVFVAVNYGLDEGRNDGQAASEVVDLQPVSVTKPAQFAAIY